MKELHYMKVIFFLGALLLCITYLSVRYIKYYYSKRNDADFDKRTLGEIGVITCIFFIGAIMCFCSIDIGKVLSSIFSIERQISIF